MGGARTLSLWLLLRGRWRQRAQLDQSPPGFILEHTALQREFEHRLILGARILGASQPLVAFGQPNPRGRLPERFFPRSRQEVFQTGRGPERVAGPIGRLPGPVARPVDPRGQSKALGDRKALIGSLPFPLAEGQPPELKARDRPQGVGHAHRCVSHLLPFGSRRGRLIQALVGIRQIGAGQRFLPGVQGEREAPLERGQGELGRA